MNKERVSLFINRNFPGRAFGVAIHTPSGVAKPLEFDKAEPFSVVSPSLSITADDAQQWMDELWHLGIRPSQEGAAGAYAAMKYHLEDMRRLVFKGKEKA